MAALVITAASVVPAANASLSTGTAGVAVTAGQVVYLDSITGKYLLADADSATPAARVPAGIAVNNAAVNQALTIQKGGSITIGATVAPGVGYYLSATAGSIAPVGDNTTGVYPTLLGFGISTTVVALVSPFAQAGVAV